MKTDCLKRYLKSLICITFCLIALGGVVRAMNAGLACPDWPLCFNKIIPHFQIQVYYEFIHRVIAGVVAMMTFILNLIVIKGNFSSIIKRTVIVANIILIAQIILGGLTVLKLLHFGVVTLHLCFGIGFMLSILWIYFNLNIPEKSIAPSPKSFHVVLFVVSTILFTQIILGGLVSSNYAGLACDGFPLCNSEWAPTWTGFVGLQVKHRLWGYFTAISIFAFTNVIRKNKRQPWISEEILKLGYWLSFLIIIQIVVGAINVLYKLPPVITVLHLALATILMAIMLRILFLGIQKK